MSGYDAFEEEMGFARRIRDEDAERLLAGPAPQRGQRPDLDEVAVFLGAARVALPAQPDPRVEVSLVQRLAATAGAANDATTAELPAVPAPAWRPRLALAAKVAVAVALLPATMAGLAFAGVQLPEPAREAFERIGLDLPNQSAVDEPTADDDGDDKASSKANERSAVAGKHDRGAHGGKSANKGKKGKGKKKDKAKDKDPKGQRGGGHGHGQGKQKEKPQGGGPSGVPPGQGGVPPGQGGTSPGSGQSAAPQGGGPPAVPPGQAKKQ